MKRKEKRALWSLGLFLLLVCFLAVPIRSQAKRGLVTRRGVTFYYDLSGEKVRNRVLNIKGRRYYFDQKGRMVKRTMKVVRGRRYYFNRNGRAVIGWKTLNGKKYWFNEKGVAAKGVVSIDGQKYCFAEDGTMQTGWQYFEENKAYFSRKTGKMQKNKTVDGVKVGKTGYVTLTYAEKAERSAMKIAEEILKTITNDQMSDAQKLRAAWSYMTSRSRFRYVTWQPFALYDGWEYDYAVQIYTGGGGNCYNFACGFAMLAKAIGYRPVVIRGRVHGSRDGAPDGFTRHCFVRINGLYYDPELDFAGSVRGIYGYGGYPLAHQILGYREI